MPLYRCINPIIRGNSGDESSSLFTVMPIFTIRQTYIIVKTSVQVCCFIAAFFCSTPLLVNATPDPASVELREKYNLDKGKKVYEKVCANCHGTGDLEAPEFCNISAWKPRIAKGMAVLVQHTIQGFRQMPTKGGDTEFNEAEDANAVAYMVDQCLIH